MSPAVPDFPHHDNEKEYDEMNETANGYADDGFPAWGTLGEMWNRMEREVRTEALKKSLDEAVSLWGMMIDASEEVHDAARSAGFSHESAEEIALGFVLKLTAGVSSAA